MATSTDKKTVAASKPKVAKTSAKKPRKMVEKPAPKPRARPVSKSAKAPEVVVTEPELKKKELVDMVVVRSGIKKKDAKPVVEAMLAVLGETIASGRELNLQPLGKLRINRTAVKDNARVIICKLRQSKAAVEKANPLLDPASAKV
ncbi:MAG: HU family DNA-binding protein [Rhodobacteraceae bacterium]|nr:HU family DNA-binding protein [Paracoccaceae bacterium]